MVYFAALVVVALDQWIKWVVATHLAVNQALAVWPGVLDILYVQNRGAAFSILVNQRILLVAISVLMMIAVVYAERRYVKRDTRIRLALGLLLGGTAGNLIDRLRLGYVVDYVYVQAIHYPVFNLADSTIVVSILYLLARFFWRTERNKGGEHLNG